METHMMRVERPDEANDLFVLIEAESYPNALLIRDYIEDRREDKVEEINLHVNGVWDCFPTKAQQGIESCWPLANRLTASAKLEF